MNHPEMAVYDESEYSPESFDWAQQQASDEAAEKRAITEATDRIYRAIQELEILYNIGLPDLRRDVRFLELVIWRKK